MLITVISFNGLALNSSNYETALLDPFASPSANISFIEQPDDDSEDADAYTVNVQTKVLSIKIKNAANRYACISELKTTFKRGSNADLLVYFSDDDTNYLMPCRVVNLVQEPGYGFNFKLMLQSSHTNWRAEDLSVVETVITGEDSIAINVGGNDETRLKADMVFTSGPGSGYINQAIYQLPNLQWALGTRPWCIELDTAAIVLAGGMLASCNDLRVNLNGSDVNRWIKFPNTNSTKIWFNVTMNRGYTFALKAAIINTNDVATVSFNFAANSNRDLDNMPTSGILYHGNEWFYYNSFNKTTLVAMIGQRGAFATTKETHAVNDVFTYIQNVVVLKFGNSQATDPALDDAHYDDTKPMINLEDSGKLLWVWNATTGFYDPDLPGRTAQWKPTSSGVGINYYLIAEDAETGAEVVMGMKLVWVLNTRTGQRTVGGASWYLNIGAPIMDTLSVTGKKMVDTGFAESGSDPDLKAGTISSLWAEADPAYDGTWYDLATHVNDALPSAATSISIYLTGSIYGQTGALGKYAEIRTASLAFENIFTGAGLLAQKSNITMDLTLINDTNGDSLGANYPLLAGKVISIDSEESIVTYDSFNYYSAIIQDDKTRPVFIRLQPGANTISLIGAVGAGTITLSWYKRRM